MKLQNEETGQVENFCIDKDQICSCDRAFVYNSLAQLQEAGWKDYKEPKTFWFVDGLGVSKEYPPNLLDRDAIIGMHKAIGNYFETREEAEKAVEKLKAWKRLRDKGLKFHGLTYEDKEDTPCILFSCNEYEDNYMSKAEDDLDLLFGGEE